MPHDCNKLFPIHPSIEEAFWRKVDRFGGDDACWPWIGGYRKGQPGNQYGHFLFYLPGTRWRVEVAAHRFALELATGAPIPEGLVACHDCPDGDNPLCCNPRHLWPGTVAQNNADRKRKGRNGKPADPAAKGAKISARLRAFLAAHPEARRGEGNNSAKLTDEVVRTIRALAANGHTHVAIAERFGVSKTTVFDVVHRRSWAHVD